MRSNIIRLPRLEPGDDFPSLDLAWGSDSQASGLLAAGGQLDVSTICRAYGNGIFPWYSENQPILWWSPDPRMTLNVSKFKLHRSLKQAIQNFRQSPNCDIRVDTSFEAVITACATSPRNGQFTGPNTTWIGPDMIDAYQAMHRSGFAHSVEVWIDGQLAGGLYCVALGKAVFGESMFSRVPNASKIALAALVSFCRAHDIESIDCQQNTRHLASLGAVEVPRAEFIHQLHNALAKPAPHWQFKSLYWQELSQPNNLAT